MSDEAPPAPAAAHAPPRGDVVVLRPFRAYRCQRTMVCCHEPFAAAVSEPDELRLRAALAQSEAGRAVLPTLSDTLVGSVGEDVTREWRKHGGRCMHLVVDGPREARGCGLHHIAGLAALPTACRNFPRVVQAVGDDWEVAFELSCPTAAKLLTEDPAPMQVVRLPPDEKAAWPYLPKREATVAAERRALRDAWWAALAPARASASAALAAISAMLEAPLTPRAAGSIALPPALGTPVTPVAAMVLVQSLLSLPVRGLSYAGVVDTLTNELVAPWPPARLVAAAEPAPELVVAFAEHQIHNLVVHSTPPAERIITLGARRALAVLRIVDALCDLVPFRSRVLFADAFTACARIDPEMGRPAPRAPTTTPPEAPEPDAAAG